MMPSKPAQEPYWTPRRAGLAFLIALAAVAVLGTLAMASPGLQASEDSQGCAEAAKEHYREALQGGGEAAFYAGLAAERLADLGEPCLVEET